MFNVLKNIGSGELIIIAVLILLFFGGKKFTELAQGLRQSKKEFNKIKEDLQKPQEGKNNQPGGDS